MENCINENIELKKRLEELELSNKNLLSQLQKLPNNQPELLPNENTSGNQFGTLLMVVVLFLAVVFGVWLPVVSKHQVSHSSSAAAAAAAASSSITRSCSPSNTMGSSSSNATTAAAVAVAAITTASMISVKSEAQESNQTEQQDPKQKLKMITVVDNSSNMKSTIPYATPCLKSRVLLPMNDDDIMQFEPQASDVNNSTLTSKNPENGPLVSTSTARSKTGTAVELTKVRPFIRKLPTIQKTTPLLNKTLPLSTPNSSGSSNVEYMEQEPQIIILNLASNSLSNQGESVTVLNSGSSIKSNNYRLINQTTNTVNPSSSTTKLTPTRFRLINSGSLSNNIITTTVNTVQHHALNNPSIIKLNSLA